MNLFSINKKPIFFSGQDQHTGVVWVSRRPESTSSSTAKPLHQSALWSEKVSGNMIWPPVEAVPSMVTASTVTVVATIKACHPPTPITRHPTPGIQPQPTTVMPAQIQPGWYDGHLRWPKKGLVMNWLIQSCILGLANIEWCQDFTTLPTGKNGKPQE